MMFEFADEVKRLTDIRVAGVGGAGGNAVDRMIASGLVGVEFLALNTDLQALSENHAHQTMQIGANLTNGQGSGGDPEIGEGAARENRDAIRQALDKANMVFVTAGMGGGTGTGAAPIVAEIAREQGALTVGIVTKPFHFEGRVRMAQAEAGIARLREVVDTLIVVPNQRLLEIVPPNTSMDEAFLIADQVLYEATRGIFEIISRHDTLNLDFADVCSVMRDMGVALMGTGRASGENRALEAARAAINSPLLEDLDIQGSKAVLVNMLGAEVGLHDTAEAMQFIQEAAGPEAHVIFGYGIDPGLGDTLQVTVVATGFRGAGEGAGTVSLAAAPAVPQPDPVSEPEEEQEVLHREPELPEDREPELDFEPEMVSVLEELDPPRPAPEPVPEPAPESEPTRPQVELVEEPARPAFLQRAASAGGQSDDPVTPETNSRFLRPAGRRGIGEVEVPEIESGPVPISRSTASGLGPEKPGEDRSTPAYIRKYMD